MGEIADSLIDGTMDAETGEFLDGDSPGYPRVFRNGKIVSQHGYVKSKPVRDEGTKSFNGISNYLKTKDVTDKKLVNSIIQDYCNSELKFKGNIKECSIEIQKDFVKFIKYLKGVQ